MKVQFIPTSKNFWRLHFGSIVVVQMAMWATMLAWQDYKIFNAIASSIWCIAFTFVVLLFRKHYQQSNSFSKSMARRVLLVVGYGLVGGVVVASIMLAIVTPFFWKVFVQSGKLAEQHISETQFLLQTLVANSIHSQLFLIIWMFMYVSITGNRRVREAELLNLRLQNSLKDAQLANLSNQLNPHFLFNALNNIRFTMYKDPAKADVMITGLSDMLRYSLESSRQDKLPLAEELEMIDRYIILTKVQMQDRLNYVQDVPAALEQCLIPPMVLQLLIENAVKHGIEKIRDGGTIALKAELKNDHQLLLSVRNTRDEHKPALHESSADSMGIGLANITSRIRLLYGDLASMQIDEAHDYFSVNLLIPRETAV